MDSSSKVYDIVSKVKKTKKSKIDRTNHNVETKRYAKLSLSMTMEEKELIQKFKDKHYPRKSVSTMILDILEEKGVFDRWFFFY